MISSRTLGERIAHRRKQREMNQAELAAKLGMSRTTIVAVEKGERKLADAELVAVAKVLEISVNELIREHSTTAEVAPRFRASARTDLMSPEVGDAVQHLERLAKLYVDLERMNQLARVPAMLESIATYRDAGASAADAVLAGEDAAQTVRSTLGLGEGPALSLEQRLEMEAGLRIFHVALPAKIAAIFIWGDELGGCIALNRAHPHARRRWSLAHELGHFLRDRERGEVYELGGSSRTDPSEVFADAFAGELLLPSSGVTRRFLERKRANAGRFTVGDIIGLAHLFEVSFQAMTLKLEKLNLLRAGTYDEIASSKFKVTEAEGRLGVSRRDGAPPLLPDRYIMLALQAYERDDLSEGELADFLQCDVVEARRIRDSGRREPELPVELDVGRNVLSPSG